MLRSSSSQFVESPGGISPPGAPRSVHEPLDSHGSRCSAASMAQLPMSEERWICSAKPIKPIARSLGLATQPLEFAARPADDIEINPLQGRTQLRPVEVAVVVDPASNARVVHLGQIWQGFVAAMMSVQRRIVRPMNVNAFGLAAGRKHAKARRPLPNAFLARNLNPRKSNDWFGKSPRRFASLQ